MSDDLVPKRVYIQYSVDFEEIPQTVRDLVREVANSLQGLQKYAAKTTHKIEENAALGLYEINQLKGLTEKLVTRLDESAEILSNYIDIVHAASDKIKSQQREETLANSKPSLPPAPGVKRVTSVVKTKGA